MNPARFGGSPTRLVAMVTALFCTAPSLAVAADVQSGVGIVAEYRPAAGRFTLARQPDGSAVPVRIGTVVMSGDRLTLPAGASVALHLANGETSQFKGPGNFQIPNARPLGKVAAILGSIPDIFDDEYRLEGTAASRGGEKCAAEGEPIKPIEVPILAQGARVVAGERDLPLAWRGGCAPFVVTVLAGGQSLVHRESIDGRQVRLDDVPLALGRYTIVIADSGGRRSESMLEATGEGPVVPAEIAADTSSLGVIAQAVWLAEQDGGRWKLESFERLRPLIRAGDPLAGTIGDGVLWGTTAR
jgi:hypothetical protein